MYNDNDIPNRETVVVITCTGDYALESEVKFVNIYEDMQGADILVFICPVCGEQHESHRLG